MIDLDDVLGLIEKAARSTVARVVDRTPVPTVGQATVISYDSTSRKVTYVLDGDTTGTAAEATTVTPWAYAAGMRIRVLLYPPAGAVVLGPVGVDPADAVQYVTSTTRPTTGLIAGRTVIYETDTGNLLRWYGTTTQWQPSVWNSKWGEIVAPAEKTTNQNGITTVTDITSLTLTWTAVQNRKYRTHLYLPVLTQVTSAGVVVAVVTDASNTVKSQVNMTLAAGDFGHVNNHERWTSPSGPVTRKARISTTAGTVDITAGAAFRAFLSVEDMGPAGAPV